jgi:DNA-binding response OmpR family regulator
VTDVAESLDLDSVPVEIVHWPADASRRDVLARSGVPRVLLVAADAEPPTTVGLDEDWIRLPAAPVDVLARARQLLRFDERLRHDRPFIDDHRVLHRAGMSVHLSAAEAVVAATLLRGEGRIVEHRELERAVWGDVAPSRDALDALVYRLRRRLGGLGMCIRSVRNRGFALSLSGRD